MIIRSLFTKHILELLLITLSWYVLVKTSRERKTSSATVSFFQFTAVNLVYQIADLLTNIFRDEPYLSGVGIGCFLYIFLLVTMALGSFLWLCYVEEELGPKMLFTQRRKAMWAIPVLVFGVLCVLSIKTGWVFTFDENGKYQMGSLFFTQYVFIFLYVLIAMARSAVNYFTVAEKRDTDRILLIVMLVDASAAVLQLVFMTNLMPVALVLNVLICYMNLYSQEVQRILQREEKLYTEQLKEANSRSDALYQMIGGYKWSYRIDAGGEIVMATYDDGIISKTDAEKTGKAIDWIDILHPDDRDRVFSEFMAAVHDSSGNTPYETVYRILRKDGRYAWARTSGRLIPHVDGTSELFGMSIDITEQMEEQQRRLLGAVLISPDILAKENIGMWAFELDDGQPPRMYGDEAMLRLVGLDHQVPPEEMYHAWYDHIDEGSRKLVNDAVEKMISGEHAEVQYPWRHPDGHNMIVRCGGVRNPEYTKGIRVEGTHQNVTEVLHYDEDEIKLRKRMNMIYSLSDEFDPILVLDPVTGKYNWYGNRTDEIGKLTARLVQGADFYENAGTDIAGFVHDDDRERFKAVYTRENMTRIAGTGETQETEYRLRLDPNGAYHWKYNKIVRMTDENGNVYVVIGVIDTTEAKEKEAREITNAVLSQYLLRSYATAYYTDLRTGKLDILQSNDGGKADTGGNAIPHDAFVETYANDFVHPDDAESFRSSLNRENIRNRLETSDSFSFNFRNISKNAPEVYRCTVIRGADKDHVASGFQNITEEVRQHEEQQRQLEAARIAADAANEAKSNFLFNMSHDIRTPMNAIRGFTAMAKKHAENENSVRDYLDKIDISGQQLLTLVNQVLEMARIESGKVVFEEKPINLRKEFNSMVTVLSEQATVKGLKFTCSFCDVEHNFVLADEARMSSIALNIAGNAMKYTPEGGSVSFDLKEVQSRKPGFAAIILTVSDTGIGMSREYLKELYEPFSREKSSTVSKIQGTGLGMSIVKSIIDRMGGNIAVQSEPGKGTRFDITLDLRIDENLGQGAEEETEVTMVSFKGRRVLLVEDNEMNREIAKDIIEEQGILVEDANDGDVAVAMVQAAADRGEPNYYDCILMDVQMPRMNGYEATKAIRAIPGLEGAHIPIIAMTANAFEEDRQNALAAGMDDHLAKPIDVQKMFRTIAKFL